MGFWNYFHDMKAYNITQAGILIRKLIRQKIWKIGYGHEGYVSERVGGS